MPQLPQIRFELDFLPSPLEDRPGLLMRDPFGFSGTTLILPAPLAPLLRFFDGQHEERDLKQALHELTGELDTEPLARHLIDSLDHAGFLANERFAGMREERMREFAAQPERYPAHAGGAYPSEEEELRGLMGRYLGRDGGDGAGKAGIGIAAPHVSPEGGWESYRDAYLALPREAGERTFVVLGTSHYGAPNRFGLTRKDFVTPFGTARTDRRAVEWLERAAPEAVAMEDYAHAIEHSIEFQVVFLQALYGPEIRVLPVLCGPLVGGRPERVEPLARFFEGLREWRTKEGREAVWVLGVDMSHIGQRYGDADAAQAGDARMVEVELEDRARIAALAAGDSGAFWERAETERDVYRWCGTAPIYTFLQAAPEARASLLRYQCWDIDPQSVVSFAALGFGAAEPARGL